MKENSKIRATESAALATITSVEEITPRKLGVIADASANYMLERLRAVTKLALEFYDEPEKLDETMNSWTLRTINIIISGIRKGVEIDGSSELNAEYVLKAWKRSLRAAVGLHVESLVDNGYLANESGNPRWAIEEKIADEVVKHLAELEAARTVEAPASGESEE